MYDDEADKSRYCVGMDGAHLIVPFQCDLCVFRTLFNRNPTSTKGDAENLSIIRRMNLDLIWAREPSTVYKNLLHLNNIITICEAGGVIPQLPCPGHHGFDDKWGWTVAYAMLVKSLKPGRHSKAYTQYATIRKLRSSASNLFNASSEGALEGTTSAGPGGSIVQVTKSPTNSLWFRRWSQGCKARMGFIIKQNKAVSIQLALALINSFINCIN